MGGTADLERCHWHTTGKYRPLGVRYQKMSVDLTKASFGHVKSFCLIKISKTSKFSRFCMFLQ